MKMIYLYNILKNLDNNNFMIAIKVIIIFFIFILIFSFPLKGYISYDFITNVGSVKFKIFFVEILYFKFFLKNNNINFVNRKLEHIVIPLTNEEDIKNYASLNYIIFKKIDIRQLESQFKFGIKNDPYSTTMVACLISKLFKVIFSVFNKVKQKTILKFKNECIYKYNCLTFRQNFWLSFSIIDYLWGILEARTSAIKLGENLKWKKRN